MCLDQLTTKEPLIAKKDIIVYKYLYKPNTPIRNRYYTYYQNTPITIRKTYRSKLLIKSAYSIISWTNTKIEVGLHSLKYKKDAIYGARVRNAVLVKCIIPKGAKYYIGQFIEPGSDCYKSLASNKLKYIEVIKDYSL